MNIYLDNLCNCAKNIAKMNQAGEISEIVFTLAAVREGYTVFTPHTHATKIDLILHKPGQRPITCQVKKGTRLKDNSRPTYKVLVGSAKSSNRLPSDTPRYSRYTEKDFDILVIDLGEHGLSFWRIEDICHQSTWRWNEDKPVNNWEILDTYYNK